MLIEESARLHAIRDEIAASRLRSTQFGLRNDRMPPYEPDVSTHKRLVAVAGPVLDSLSDELAGTSVGLLLADQRARIVDRRVKDRALRSVLDRAQLSLGHGWDERQVGTNAIGTALESAVPVIVRGREHFADSLATVTCAAATITDVRTGQLLGAIGLVCAVQDTNALMLPYACRISVRLKANSSRTRRSPNARCSNTSFGPGAAPEGRSCQSASATCSPMRQLRAWSAAQITRCSGSGPNGGSSVDERAPKTLRWPVATA